MYVWLWYVVHVWLWLNIMVAIHELIHNLPNKYIFCVYFFHALFLIHCALPRVTICQTGCHKALLNKLDQG